VSYRNEGADYGDNTGGGTLSGTGQGGSGAADTPVTVQAVRCKVKVMVIL